jgi:large subunit ribosomal protein L19
MAAKTTKGGASKAKTSTSKAGKKAQPRTTGTDLVRRVTWDRIASKKTLPHFDTGDAVGVYVKVKEGEKERVQLFSGVVIKVQGSGPARSFTVRKIASGVGVERTFPMQSPIIEKVEVLSHGKVRRGRLFYLRGLKGRSARLETVQYIGEEATPGAADELAAEPIVADGAAVAEAKAEKEKKPAKS